MFSCYEKYKLGPGQTVSKDLYMLFTDSKKEQNGDFYQETSHQKIN